MRILFYIFLVWLVYQLITRFIIPVYKTTKQVKKGFKEMNEKMNDYVKQQQQSQQTSQAQPPNREPVGDYIDFEEIK